MISYILLCIMSFVFYEFCFLWFKGKGKNFTMVFRCKITDIPVP